MGLCPLQSINALFSQQIYLFSPLANAIFVPWTQALCASICKNVTDIYKLPGGLSQLPLEMPIVPRELTFTPRHQLKSIAIHPCSAACNSGSLPSVTGRMPSF